MNIDTSFAILVLAIIAFAFGIAAVAEAVTIRNVDKPTWGERLRTGFANVAFTVKQKAAASARLVKLLGSIVVTVALAAVVGISIVAGAVAGPVGLLGEIVWMSLRDGYRTTAGAAYSWLDRVSGPLPEMGY